MSIENTLERIAAALELIAKNTAGANVQAPKPAASESKADASTAAESTTTTPKAPTPPPAPPAAEPTAPPAAPSTGELVVKDADECNALLVEEYKRLGGTPEAMTSIQKIMSEKFDARSVNGLEPAQMGPLITAVRAL